MLFGFLMLQMLVGCRALDALQNFRLAKGVVGCFRAPVNALYNVVGNGDAPPVKLIKDVRLAAHRPDVNHLLEAKHM